MTATLTPAQPTLSSRIELATYHLPTGRRVIYGQRILGHVRLIDAPSEGTHGRTWIIESNLEQDGNSAMLAVINDYVSQATRHQCIPAAPAGVSCFITALENLDTGDSSERDLALAA